MNLNQLGLVIYRGALVASVLSVAVALLKLGDELKKPIRVKTEVLGDVSVGSLPAIDFASAAFVGAGQLEVDLPDPVDMHIER